MIDKFEEYFLRIVLLLMKYGGMVLQLRIKFELRSHKWQTISDFLSERKHDILHLTLGSNTTCCEANCKVPIKSSRPLHRAFLSVMFQNVESSCSPRSKYRCSCHFAPKADLDKSNGISNWDITLTSSLLLEFIIKEPSQRQVILNLRNYRNSQEILHRGKPCMDEDEFSKTWMKVSVAIMEIAEKCEPWEFHTISKEIHKLKSDSLTYSELLQLEDFWMNVMKTDDLDHIGDDICKLSSLISDLMSKVQENSTNSTEMKNLACYTDYCLREHSKKIYIKPQKAMAYSLKHLEDYKTIFIIGNAGTGKTQFCLELMTEFLKKHPDVTPMILTESSQWNKIKFESKHIIFVDDVVGKSNLNVGAFESWSRQFDIMSSKLSIVYIIFALRSCIWQLKKDDLNDFTLFKLCNPVDLSGSKFGLTSEEKLRMLTRFCKRDGIAFENTFCEKNLPGSLDQDLTSISQNSLKIIAGMDLTKGFPYLCEKFFSCKKSLRMGLRFFELYSANSYEKEQVDILLGQKKYLHYVILVFIFLNDNFYSKNGILGSSKEIACLAEKLLGMIPKQVTKPEIKNCICEMQNTFISVSDHDCLKLRHMVTYEAVLLSFSKNFPEEFLDSINKTVLFAYVRSKGYIAEENEVVVHLDDDMTKALARKLLDVYGTNIEEAFTDVYKHPAFHDKNLVISFLDIVESVVCFKTFLGSFVAGACMDKKDILASETIGRFFGHYTFDSQTFDIVVNSDLIHTCFQFFNNGWFRKYLFEANESGVISRLWEFFIIACRKGSLRCVKALINICNKEDVLDLEVDGDLKNLMRPNILNIEDSIHDIVRHHTQSGEDGWSKVLIQLDDLLCPCYPGKQTFYEKIVEESLIEEKFDLVIDYLEKLNPFKSSALNTSIWWCVILNNSFLFNALCGKILSGNIHLDSKTADSMCFYCANEKNEEMFLTFLNQIECDFYLNSESTTTILHACEENNFSSSTLLKLLQRADVQRMFTLKDFIGRTPVQCRTSYKEYCRPEVSFILDGPMLYDEKSRYIKLHGRQYSFKRHGEKGTFRSPYQNVYGLSCKRDTLNRYFFPRGFQFNSFISGAYSFPFKDFRDDSLIAYSSLEC